MNPASRLPSRLIFLLWIIAFLPFVTAKAQTVPVPVLEVVGMAEDPQWPDYVFFTVQVLNGGTIPSELFASAPDLPACGANANSSRTWVTVYAVRNGSVVGSGGFCNLNSLDGVQLTMAVLLPPAGSPPARLYIELNDRRTATLHRSAEIPASLPPASAIPVAPSGPTHGIGGLAPGVHEVTLSGQPARIIVGTGYDPSRPTYLAYYLHGDEGGYTYFSSAGTAVRKLIDRYGMIFVAPRAPESTASPGVFPWDGRGGGSQTGNATQVMEVLDHMFSRYNVYRDKVLGAGASGGSWFHDAVFFPRHAAMYPSYFNLCCGAAGQKPGYFTYSQAVNLSRIPSVSARSELKYTIGTADFLFPGAEASAPTYDGLGFAVETEFLTGVAHCAFNVDAEIAEYWELVLRAFEARELALTAETAPSGELLLTWDTVPGRSYTVQAADSLSDGPWLRKATVIGPAAPATFVSWSEPRPAGKKSSFYRVEVGP